MKRISLKKLAFAAVILSSLGLSSMANAQEHMQNNHMNDQRNQQHMMDIQNGQSNIVEKRCNESNMMNNEINSAANQMHMLNRQGHMKNGNTNRQESMMDERMHGTSHERGMGTYGPGRFGNRI